jgi:uncharacterized protein
MRWRRSRRAQRSRRMQPETNLSLLERLPRQAAHLLIRGYQLSLSAFIGRYCRHEPTCSAYMDEAIARHGLMMGGWLGTKRLCRCHPWGTSGYDPVPETITNKNRILRCDAGRVRSERTQQ